jgi:hypothetical protein
MVCTPIYSFSALEGKYLEPATSLHPIKAEGYETHPDFISLVRELNFSRRIDENPYKHLQDFEEICATLMISGMNHETLKRKAFPFPLTGWAKQWYKLHASSCHGSWVILKGQFCFALFPLSKIIDLRNEVLNFAQKEGESWEQPGPDTINLLCRVKRYIFLMLCLCSILCTGWIQNPLNMWI